MRIPIIAALVVLSACARHTITTGAGGASGSFDDKIWHSGLVGGLIELSDVDATESCGGKPVAAVGDNLNFCNLLVNGLTFGIYTSSVVKVWCGDGSANAAEPNVEGVATVEGSAPEAITPTQ